MKTSKIKVASLVISGGRLMGAGACTHKVRIPLSAVLEALKATEDTVEIALPDTVVATVEGELIANQGKDGKEFPYCLRLPGENGKHDRRQGQRPQRHSGPEFWADVEITRSVAVPANDGENGAEATIMGGEHDGEGVWLPPEVLASYEVAIGTSLQRGESGELVEGQILAEMPLRVYRNPVYAEKRPWLGCNKEEYPHLTVLNKGDEGTSVTYDPKTGETTRTSPKSKGGKNTGSQRRAAAAAAKTE